MRVIVTRPATQAVQWVAQLQAHGLDGVALPLTAIEPARDAAPIHAAWAGLAAQQLVVFVSPNAVDQFFAYRPALAGSVIAPWPPTLWAASPGPGTTHTLRGWGVPAAQILEPAADAAQFDSESLWLRLAQHDWRGASVLIVRGEGSGREWLASTLSAHGATVRQLAAYGRAAPVLSGADVAVLAAALAAPAQHLWLFSSSQAIDHLAQHTPTTSTTPGAAWAKSCALTTHPRIAERARQLGFTQLIESRPALDAVMSCIQSWRS